MIQLLIFEAEMYVVPGFLDINKQLAATS